MFMGTVRQMCFVAGRLAADAGWRTPVRPVTYESLDHSLALTAQDRHRVLGVLLSTIPQDLGASGGSITWKAQHDVVSGAPSLARA